MKYFEPDYLDFFKELAANNNKEWFDANRKRYEAVVRDPFKHFVGELIHHLAARDPELNIEPKDVIFRINRDIRFSKDKTPYKTNNSAVISPEGRKNKNHPGIYIEFGPERMAFYGGIYMPSPKEVGRVRTYMSQNLKELEAILSSRDFVDNFGVVHGEKSKRIPKELMEAAGVQSLIWNKNWYYFKHLPPETIIGDELMETILDLRDKSEPIKNYLHNAIFS